MTEPKLGDQILGSPNAKIVADPPATTPSGLAIPAEPPIAPDPNHISDPPPAPDPADLDSSPDAQALVADGGAEPDPAIASTGTIVLENGGRVQLGYTYVNQEFRVRAANGEYYEHVGALASGEWTYRQVK